MVLNYTEIMRSEINVSNKFEYGFFKKVFNFFCNLFVCVKCQHTYLTNVFYYFLEKAGFQMRKRY